MCVSWRWSGEIWMQHSVCVYLFISYIWNARAGISVDFRKVALVMVVPPAVAPHAPGQARCFGSARGVPCDVTPHPPLALSLHIRCFPPATPLHVQQQEKPASGARPGFFFAFLYFLSGSLRGIFTPVPFSNFSFAKTPMAECVLKQASHTELLVRLKVKTRTQRAAEVRRVTGTERLQQCVRLNCRPVAKSQPFSRPNPVKNANFFSF